MAYQRTPKEQLCIIRQSCLNRAVDLYTADKIDITKIETTAEYFVGLAYTSLGMTVGDAFSEAQVQGVIVFQSSLARAVEIVVSGKAKVTDIVDSTLLFAKYVYAGIENENR